MFSSFKITFELGKKRAYDDGDYDVGHVLYSSSMMREKTVAGQPRVNSLQVTSRAGARGGFL